MELLLEYESCLQFVIVVFPDHTHLLFSSFCLACGVNVPISLRLQTMCIVSVSQIMFRRSVPHIV